MGLVLRKENYNIMGVQWKIQFLAGGGYRKKPENSEDCLKSRLGKLANLIGSLAKKKCFWEGWYPNAHDRYKKQEPKY